MDIKCISTDMTQLFSSCRAQALVEGEIPLSVRADKLLCVSGSVQTHSVTVGSECVELEGRVRITVVTDGPDGVSGSTSSAEFTHTVAVEGALESMHALAVCELTALDAVVDAGHISISSVVDIQLNVYSCVQIPGRLSIPEAPDAEFLTRTGCVHEREAYSCEQFSLREEINVKSAERVIASFGSAFIKSIENGEVNFILYVSALAVNAEGALFPLSLQLPLSHMIGEADEADSLAGDIEVCSISLSAAGDGTATVEAQLELRLFAVSEKQISFTCDAYSPAHPFVCHTQSYTMTDCQFTSCIRQSIDDHLIIPESMSPVKEPVFCHIRPLITDAAVENSVLTVEGLLFVHLIYRCDKSLLHSYACDMPFSFDTPVSASNGAHVSAQARTQYCSASGSGRNVDIDAGLIISACVTDRVHVDCVCSVEQSEHVKGPSGILVYCASTGESAFALGKRLSVPMSALASYADEKGELHERQKLVMLI